MADRRLLRADREGYGYKDLLEVAPGGLRLIITDRKRRRRWWLYMGGLDIAYLTVLALVLSLVWPAPLEWLTSVLGEVWGVAVYTALFWAGFLAIAAFGDFYLPAQLAKHPVGLVPLQLVGSESYGFFQELQVRSGSQVQRITVNGTRRSVARALRVAGLRLDGASS